MLVQHRAIMLLDAKCWACLNTMMDHVGYCWMVLDDVE